MLFILISLFLISLYVVWNLLKKVERYEESIEILNKEISERDNFYEKINELIKTSNQKINELDEKQMFSGDDDIGFFFDNVKKIQSYLDAYRKAFEDFKK